MSFFSRKKSSADSSPGEKKALASPHSNLQALEPRIMFDAAGMIDFHDTVNEFADSPESPDSYSNEHQEVVALFKDYTPPTQNTSIKEIIFIDSGVENPQALLGNIPSGSTTFTLNKEVDAVQQMTSILTSFSKVDAVHIVSHGHAGQLDFSAGPLNTSTLDSHSADLSNWSRSLSEHADIMIYGCDVASGTEGENFIGQISQLTNADVAASTDTTGSTDQGGDWDLETATGSIESSLAFSKTGQAAWQGTLDTATLVSVDSAETIANGSSYEKPDVTPDGHYVAFSSNATNLVSGDSNSVQDIFVRDTKTGDTVRVSVDSAGIQADGSSYNAQISFSGRFVSYSSNATNLVTGDTNGVQDIFVHDRDADNDGIFDEAGAITTTRVSVDSVGIEANIISGVSAISDDGRYVAFESNATNLVTGDTNTVQDIFVHDRDTDNDGIFDEAGAITTTRASVDSSGLESNSSSYSPQISADGRFIAYRSSASNLVATDTNTVDDIFVHDRDADNDGIFDEAGAITTTRVSVDSSGLQATGGSSYNPVISADGRFIAFESSATNLVAGDTNAANDIFVHDRDADDDGIFDEAGAVITQRVSVASDGTEGNSWSMSPNISDGGHLITFTSNSTNLVPGDVNGTDDVFIHDTFAGETTLASDLLNTVASGVVITGDGRHLVLTTNSNLVGADVNAFDDVYIIDRNDAPSINPNGVATLNAIIQNDTTSDGTPVGDIVNAVFSDVDTFEFSEPGMAITGVDNSNGTWQYSTDYGSSWLPLSGLSDTYATLLAGKTVLTSQPVGNTNIAASTLFINGSPTSAINLATGLTNGINMEGAWNLANEINSTANMSLWADLTTLYSSNVAATIGGSTTVDFILNGVNVNFTTTGTSVALVVTDTVNAINAVSNQSHVEAFVGDGTNGGITDAIVLKNTGFGQMHPIDIINLTETGTASTGLTNMHQDANATNNTGQITIVSKGKFEISTSVGNDSILNIIGLGGGSTSTKQPGDIAADGKVFVSSGPNRIRFLPNTDYVGNASITFRTWDFSDGQEGDTGFDVSTNGGSTAFSTATTTAEITVNPSTVDTLVPDGPEFQVNTYTTNTQNSPTITSLNGGDFVMSWYSQNQDGDAYGVYAQRYDAAGNPVGAEFQVNTLVTSAQQFPSITSLNDGGFVITWQSYIQDGDNYGIYAQRYDAAGNPDGTEFQINTYVTSSQASPSVTSLNDGGFVVTWQSENQDGGSQGIYAQRYDAIGNPVSPEFLVNTYVTFAQANPSVTSLSDGGFVVTWESNNQDGNNNGIYAQRYDSTGNSVGDEFRINTYVTASQNSPSVTSLNDGGFVVTWQSDSQDGDLYGIYAQRYDANGNPVGSEFKVNTYVTASQDSPSITSLNDGGFVVAWHSNSQDGDASGVYAQRYDISGNPVGAEFQVNTYVTSIQDSSSITSLNDGGFVVTWQSFGQDGNSYGIFAQRYSFNDAPVLNNAGIMSLSSIAEGNTDPAGDTIAAIISSAGGDRITDINNTGAEGIAITNADITNGTWEYSTDTGATWTAFGAVSSNSATLLADTPSTKIRFLPNASYTGSATITFQAWDQTTGSSGDVGVDATISGGTTAFSTALETASIAVVPGSNDAPVLSASAPTLSPITEDEIDNSGDLISSLIGASITDLDSGALEGIAIYSLESGNGSWEFSTDTGLTWNSIEPVSPTSALLLQPTDSIRFTPDANNSDTANFSYYAWDQTTGSAGSKVDASIRGGQTSLSSDPDTASITVTALNDAPVLDPNHAPIETSMNENTVNGPGYVVADIIINGSISDVDTTAVEAIAISAVDNSNGTWEYSTDSGSTWKAIGSVNTTNALLVDSINKIRFEPNTHWTGTTDISFCAWDKSAGTEGTYADTSTRGDTSSFSILTDTASVIVSPANTLDMITAGSTLNFTENDTPSIIDPTITLTDSATLITLERAMIRISTNYAAGEDLLSFVNTDTISGIWDASSATMILTGSDTVTNYQDALRSITYTNISENPSLADRTISWKVNNDQSDSQVATSTITMTNVNDAPIISTRATVNYTEIDAPTVIDAGITITDPDSTQLHGATIHIAPGFIATEDFLSFTPSDSITGIWDAETATLTLTGTDSVENYQATLQSVTYKNTASSPNPTPRTVNFVVNDGTTSSTIARSTINIVEHPPQEPPPSEQPTDPTEQPPPANPPLPPVPPKDPSPEQPTAPTAKQPPADPPLPPLTKPAVAPEPLAANPDPPFEPLKFTAEFKQEQGAEGKEPVAEARPLEPEQQADSDSEPRAKDIDSQKEQSPDKSKENGEELEGEQEDLLLEEEQEEEQNDEELEEEGEEEGEEEVIIDEVAVVAAPQTLQKQTAIDPEKTGAQGAGMSAQLAAEAEKVSMERKEIIKVLDEAFQLLQCK